jgi:hypothetical protein
MGRKPNLTPHQRQEALARLESGEALTEIARTYNVSHSTISRLLWERTTNYFMSALGCIAAVKYSLRGFPGMTHTGPRLVCQFALHQKA